MKVIAIVKFTNFKNKEEKIKNIRLTQDFDELSTYEEIHDLFKEEANDYANEHYATDDYLISFDVVMVNYEYDSSEDKVYQICQYDGYFNYASRVEFGTFKTLNEAYNNMLEGFEELYKGFKNNVYSNGTNQWLNDEHSFGVMINEIKLGKFEEL